MRRNAATLIVLAILLRGASAGAALRVAVTLGDMETLVQAIGGSAVETFAVMPPGSDPHSVSLSAGLVQQVQDADLVVFADSRSLAFEGDLKRSLTRTPTLDWQDYAAEGARLQDFSGMPSNPHGFWLDFDNAASIGRAVASALISRGADRGAIDANAVKFARELTAHREAARAAIEASGSLGDTACAVVPGVAYTIRNLSLSVGGILLADEGSGQADANRLLEITQMLSRGQARFLVCPIGLKESKAGAIAEQLARDTGTKVVYTRFLWSGSSSRSFLGDATYNAIEIARAAAAPGQGPEESSHRPFSPLVLGLAGAALLGLVVLVVRRVLSR